MEKIKVGVVGVGHLGSIHARIYSELTETELVGVSDTNPRRLKAVARKFSCPAFEDYRALLKEVEALSIATPTRVHYQSARDALREGVHVLVEKPITATAEEAGILVKEAKEKKLVLQVGHTERFNSAVQALTRMTNNPRFIECHRLGPFKRRSLDIGVVMDLMIHDLDIVLELVKSPIERIDAAGASVLSPLEDIANVRISFKSGAVANLNASRLTKKSLRKIRVFSGDSYFSLDCLNQTIETYRLKNGKIKRRFLRVKKKEPLQEEIKSFIRCLKRGGEPQVSGLQGKLALEVALEISKKIKENG